VKLYYQLLTSHNGSSFPWKSIWRVKGSFEGGVCCVIGSFRENSDSR
jgi:hypothetical protein